MTFKNIVTDSLTYSDRKMRILMQELEIENLRSRPNCKTVLVYLKKMKLPDLCNLGLRFLFPHFLIEPAVDLWSSLVLFFNYFIVEGFGLFCIEKSEFQIKWKRQRNCVWFVLRKTALYCRKLSQLSRRKMEQKWPICSKVQAIKITTQQGKGSLKNLSIFQMFSWS